MENLTFTQNFNKYRSQHTILRVKTIAENFGFILFCALLATATTTFGQAPNISYSSPQVYVAGTTVSPLSPSSTGGSVPANPIVTLATGIVNPYSVAVDAAGNLFVPENVNGIIVKIPAGGGAPVTVASNLGGAISIAVDASGNLYFNAGAQVKEIQAGGTAVTTFASGFTTAYGLATDAAGNLYVSDYASNNVSKVPAGGGTPIVLATGFNHPEGVAIDAAGNVFVADNGGNAIKEIAIGGGAALTIATCEGSPDGIAVDGAGNIYYADPHNPSIKVIVKADGSKISLGSGFSAVYGVTLDSAGNVYVVDNQNQAIKKLVLAGFHISGTLPAGLAFDQNTGTLSGTPTVTSPATGHIVWAFNANGSSSAGLNLSVVPNAASLTSLSYNAGSLSPAFNPIVYNYSSHVVKTTTSVTVTPVTQDPAATVKINGATVSSGSASAPITLSFGANAITTVVTSAQGGTLTYTLTVYRDTGIPKISYASPQVYTQGTNIPQLTPTNTDAAVTAPQQKQPYLGGSYKIIALAADTNGNVYFASNANNSIEKVTSTTTVTAVGTGFITPTGIAVDAAGNIFVADEGNNAVKKMSATGANITTIASGFNHLNGIAVDAGGNIYISDSGTNTVSKIPSGSSSATILASGFNNPGAIAVDAAGNVFVADKGNSVIKQVLAAGGAVVALTTGVITPASLATDTFGNLYFADPNSNVLQKIVPGAGIVSVINRSFFNNPALVTLDAKNNVYTALTDQEIDEITFGGYAINAVLPTGLSFNYNTGVISGMPTVVSAAKNYTITGYNSLGSSSATVSIQVNQQPVPVISYSGPQVYAEGTPISPLSPANTGGPVNGGGYSIAPALPAGLSFSQTTGIISGTPTALSPATNYIVTGTNYGGSGTATINIKVNAYALPTISYASPQVYSAGNQISPLTPVSTSVLPASYNTTPIVMGTGLNQPFGIAVDGFGNVYVADAGNNAIKKIPVGGGTPVSLGSGFSNPTGVAFRAGKLYVADKGNNAIKQMAITGGTPVTLASGFNAPSGVWTDGAGNIYVADSGNNAIKEILAADNSIVTLGSGFNAPTGVAVDAYGNVFVADKGNNAVKMITAGTGSIVTLASGFSSPSGVSVDATGNIYVADMGNSQVKKIFAGTTLPVMVSSGFGTGFSPSGVIVDNVGNLYAVDHGNNVVNEITPVGGYYLHPALPKGLTMDNNNGVISGIPLVASVAANYTIVAYNPSGSGTATLNIAVNALAKPNISYGGSQVYTAGTAISPLVPANTGGAVAAQSQIIAAPASGDLLSGLAVDAAGNIYEAQGYPDYSVVKLPASGGPSSIISANGTGVAVDAAGNLYVADEINNNVTKYPVGGGPGVAVGTGFSSPVAVAVDIAGNVYVADRDLKTVQKVPVGGGAQVNIGPGLVNPTGVAVDAQGNVYVVDSGTGLVKEFPGGGGSPVVLFSEFGGTTGIVVDNAGYVYLSNNYDVQITKLQPGGGTLTTIRLGGYAASALALGPDGSLYTNGPASSYPIYKINPGGYTVYPALPAGLVLDKTTGIISGIPASGSPSSNYTIAGQNSSGYGFAIVNITVNTPPPPAISYSGPQVFTSATAITPVAPSNSGGAVPATNITRAANTDGFANDFVIDAAGNYYATENIGATGLVVKIPANGGPTVTLTSVNYSSPQGIAVDGAGNVYFENNSAVFKIPAAGGTPVSMGSFGVSHGIAIDAAGNVFVAATEINMVYKIPAGGGAAVAIGSGFLKPMSVAVDAAGNVFVDDFGHNAIKKIPAGGGAPITLSLNVDSWIAADPSGNLYFVNSSLSVSRIDPAGAITVINGTANVYNVAVNSSGTLFISDGNIEKVNPCGYFVSPALPAGLLLDQTTGIISGAASAASPATNYTITAYNSGGQSSTNINITVTQYPLPVVSYAGPQVFTINQPIAPLSPASSGVGAFGFTSPVAVAHVAEKPQGIAVDAGGNIYEADEDIGAIHRFAPGNSRSVNLGTGFDDPTGVALDAARNVYVADYIGNFVKKIAVGTGTTTLLSSGLSLPYGIALDAAGNIYVSEQGNNDIKRIPAGGGTAVVIGTGFNLPQGIAVDGTGNVYVADNGNKVIKEIPAGGGSTITLATGSGAPTGVAVDADGNLYIADTQTSTIKMLPAGGGAIVSIPTGIPSPFSIAISPSGDLYVGDGGNFNAGNQTVYEANRTGGYSISPLLPPGLIFSPTTGVISGTPTMLTAAKNYIVTAYNIGGNKTTAINIAVSATSSNANLSKLLISKGILSPAFSSATTSYTNTVSNTITSITVTPTSSDPHATLTVNGTAVTSGTASVALPLAVGPNTITTVVTAQDGTTTKTYTITVTRAPSNNAKLARLVISRGVLSPTFNAATTSYTAGVGNAITSMTVTPTTSFAGATVTVNGTPVTSGTASGSISLATGPNTITTVVTAQDGITTMSYTVTITRAGGSLNIVYEPVSVEKPLIEPQIQDRGIIVHQGLSPNGDGVNDFLMIDGIANYPDNKLQIMNRSGQLIFEAKNYDNNSKVFDGHSNKTGAMQLPGTYFYSLDYVVDGAAKHKTGFIVLKY